jgi:hypothetical protein
VRIFDEAATIAFMAIEDIILSHSRRGMHLLRPYLELNFCGLAAEALLSAPRGTIGITTGFWVNGKAETDGPLGAYFLGKGLETLGFDPIIISDQWCLPLFEDSNLACIEVNAEHDSWHSDWNYFCQGFSPAALISIERCGRNSGGSYANMFGASLNEYTAPIDRWFDAAPDSMLTIGIGDGGNEIGMGNIAAMITEELNIKPCLTRVDHLIIASVSNWGAFGLLAALEAADSCTALPSRDEYLQRLDHIVKLGAVDGVTGKNQSSVDGYPIETDLSILDQLCSMRQR